MKPLPPLKRTSMRRSPTRVLIYRVDPSPTREPIVELPPLQRSGTVSWDGTVRGRKVRPGTYLVALRTRDRAGNETTQKLTVIAQQLTQTTGVTVTVTLDKATARPGQVVLATIYVVVVLSNVVFLLLPFRDDKKYWHVDQASTAFMESRRPTVLSTPQSSANASSGKKRF